MHSATILSAFSQNGLDRKELSSAEKSPVTGMNYHKELGSRDAYNHYSLRDINLARMVQLLVIAGGGPRRNVNRPIAIIFFESD